MITIVYIMYPVCMMNHFFKNMIRVKYKARITADQWRSNASYNIFLDASHAESPLKEYTDVTILKTRWPEFCHKNPPRGGSKEVPLSHLCLWSMHSRHLLNWLGITTGWHILWEVQIYWRRSSGPTENTVPTDLKISGTFSPAEASNAKVYIWISGGYNVISQYISCVKRIQDYS